ncbi:MAG: hypothetical protein HDS66_04440 [Bacteroidales bacterium]|nr:hypothetical protein [Bacteroidales bacterium]
MKQDFTEIRRLLPLWYEALTTPEQEQVLIDTLGTLPADAVPADLLPDYRIFSSMVTNVSVTPIEADKAIALAIGSRKRFPRRLLYTGIAASLAAALLTGVFVFNSHRLTSQSCLQPMIASTLTTQPEAPAPNISPVPLASPTAECTTPATPRKRHAPKRKKTPAADSANDYITPTSPDEASEILNETLQLFASVFTETLDDAKATTSQASNQAGRDLQDAINKSHRGMEQIIDITANTINSI